MSAEYCTICGRWHVHGLTTAGCPKPEITVVPARDQTNYDPEAERKAREHGPRTLEWWKKLGMPRNSGIVHKAWLKTCIDDWAASDAKKDAEIIRLKTLAITMLDVWYRTNHILDRETYEAKLRQIEEEGEMTDVAAWKKLHHYRKMSGKKTCARCAQNYLSRAWYKCWAMPYTIAPDGEIELDHTCDVWGKA